MGDAVRIRDYHDRRLRAQAAVPSGKLWQLADGEAAYYQGLDAAAVDDFAAFRTEGIVEIPKTTGLAILDGQETWWDHSAAKAHIKSANDRDFFAGSAVGDYASGDALMKVNLNRRPNYLIDLQREEFLGVIVKTVVGSTTVEVPHYRRFGGATSLFLGTTAEAQKLDLLSQKGFAVASKWIAEWEVNIIDDGAAAALDFNVGVANATHASDADAIAESCFIHTDGNVVDLLAESDDGTTEVPATDTTVNYALGTPFHVVMDGRDPADIQIYIDGVLVLGSTVFTLAAATGPLKLLAHLEKSADATPGDFRIVRGSVRLMQQAGAQR